MGKGHSKGQYFSTYSSYWNSKTVELLTPFQESVFHYLRSCQNNNGLGCFVATLKSLYSGYKCRNVTKSGFSKAFEALKGFGLVVVDGDKDLVYLPGFVENGPPTNDGSVQKLGNSFNRLPDSPLKTRCYVEYREYLEEHNTETGARLRAFYDRFEEPEDVNDYLPTKQKGNRRIELPGYDGDSVPPPDLEPVFNLTDLPPEAHVDCSRPICLENEQVEVDVDTLFDPPKWSKSNGIADY